MVKAVQLNTMNNEWNRGVLKQRARRCIIKENRSTRKISGRDRGVVESALKITERVEWERCIVCGGYSLEVVLYVVLLKWK